MSFSAITLQKKTKNRAINDEVNTIYNAIKTKIRDANYEGKCSIEVDLPDTFCIETLELKDLQLVIYTDIIQRLEDDYFDVSIDLHPHDTRLFIKWTSAVDKTEMERRRQIIASHLYRGDVKKSQK